MASLMKSSKRVSEAIDELLSRGVTEIIDRTHLRKVLLAGKPLRIKLGIDPTGPRIHLGNAVIIRKLRDFQRLGHKAVFIVGDFTAQIGDPSDKLAKRPMLTALEVKANLKSYRDQLSKIIDLSRAEFVFNSRWLSKLTFKEVALLAETFTVQQMLARRNFKERYEKGTEISIREFLYPLMQGYDSVEVKADVEIGGFDQLFNVMAGRTIQQFYGQKPQDILTGEMLEGTDGRKMSKSWGNVINITDEPNDMFGKVMSVRDDLIIKYFTLTTDVSLEEIKIFEKDLKSGKLNPRDAKARLAREIVSLYHGDAAAKKAEAEFDKVFRTKGLPSEIKTKKLTKPVFELAELLVATRLAKSKSEAARLIGQGGVKIDGIEQSDFREKISLSKEGVLIQVGKRNFLRVSL
ncbi:MAG TPA: tyrosine--tRNA ligase [Candidatus Tyrphobacter sp.]|nr:tyrosine--tRNA ligase [Candidatus Tyrphobacter sp.]